MKIEDSEFKEVSPDLVPLLDVVFQLIMFFMITMSFIQIGQVNHEVLLPVAQAATPLDQPVEDWIFLNMNREGKLIGTAEDINSESKLRAFLQTERQRLLRLAQDQGKAEPNIVVVLRADKDAAYEDVYAVLDSCSRAGYSAWQLRVRTQPGRR